MNKPRLQVLNYSGKPSVYLVMGRMAIEAMLVGSDLSPTHTSECGVVLTTLCVEEYGQDW